MLGLFVTETNFAINFRSPNFVGLKNRIFSIKVGIISKTRPFLRSFHFDDHILNSSHLDNITQFYKNKGKITQGITQIGSSLRIVLPNNSIEGFGRIDMSFFLRRKKRLKFKHCIIFISFHNNCSNVSVFFGR
jgi:hypothetical protein